MWNVTMPRVGSICLNETGYESDDGNLCLVEGLNCVYQTLESHYMALS